MAAEPRPNPYGDTPAPKTFQHVSPLDPQLFSTMSEHADELLRRQDAAASTRRSRSRSGSRISPTASSRDLDRRSTERDLRRPAGRDRRRRCKRGSGRFFAAKFSAGVLYAIHERTGDRRALDETLAGLCRDARRAWAAARRSRRARCYAGRSVGERQALRSADNGSTASSGIDADIERSRERRASVTTRPTTQSSRTATTQALGRPRRDPAPCTHTPPVSLSAQEPRCRFS